MKKPDNFRNIQHFHFESESGEKKSPEVTYQKSVTDEDEEEVHKEEEEDDEECHGPRRFRPEPMQLFLHFQKTAGGGKRRDQSDRGRNQKGLKRKRQERNLSSRN